MKIICVKLTTGEDIIGRLETELAFDELGQAPSGTITMSKTRVISLQEIPTQQGPRMAMALLPFLMGNHDANVVINLGERAICVYQASKPIEDSYIAQTTELDLSAKSKIQLS